MNKLLNNNKDLTFIVNGFFFSILTFIITANLKIIIPTNTGWLKVGDGISEISWEFFRRQPIFQFPLGLNTKYGLEISSAFIDSCTFNLDFSTCSINLKNLNLLNQVLNISVQPEAILNRHDWSKILISYMEFNQL